MRYVDEFRTPERVRALAQAIERAATKPWRLMEICGGQTHSILRHGLDQLLPPGLELIHGPGCPVCVTPTEKIDRAIALASLPGVVLCSFGDMLRVPGSDSDLLTAKARGADVRVVHSPLEAVELARALPERQVVFFAVGFETTAPANAMAVARAKRDGLRNFSLLVAQVLVPPALVAILNIPDHCLHGILAAGHVCTVAGTSAYVPIATKYRLPIVVTGFEPVDILQGILLCVRQLEAGTYVVENQYQRSVRADGNLAAQAQVDQVFQPVTMTWRGLGPITASGLGLRPDWAAFDAEGRFPDAVTTSQAPSTACQAGAVLTGRIKPPTCSAFGKDCTPDHPLGAPMVSTEGACAAYFHYGRRQSHG